MLLKRILRRLPGFARVDRYLRRRYTGSEHPELAPRGHPSSPLPDIDTVVARADRIYGPVVDALPGLDLRPEDQRTLLTILSFFYEECPWHDSSSRRHRFHPDQRWFGYGDALILYGMLRHLRPKRIIEVGSGFSSAAMLDTNDLFLAGHIQFTFIDPDLSRLRTLLRPEDSERCVVIQSEVQDLPLAAFRALEPDDILFIDSSHASKIGSDVNYLTFEVLPRLANGVVVHFHDILWPFEYPIEWITGGVAFNEVYLIRAFLQYNNAFRILLFNSYAAHCLDDVLNEHMPRFLKAPGSSLWLRKQP